MSIFNDGPAVGIIAALWAWASSTRKHTRDRVSRKQFRSPLEVLPIHRRPPASRSAPAFIMVASFSLYTNFMVVLALACSVQALSISLPRRDITTINYTTTHSLGDSYYFHRRDGWTSYNASNISPRTSSGEEVNSGVAKRSEKTGKKLGGSKKLKGELAVIGGALKNIVSAIITW